MTIFSECEETVLQIYYCPVCQTHWKNNFSNISCLVNHGPGSCCHYGDTPIVWNDKVKESVMKLLVSKESVDGQG